jgi:putative ABC transport system permease protein
MSPIDTLRFALNSLTAHRLRTILSATGIGIGIAAVILLTSIGEGIHQFVLSEFTQFGTNIINVTPGKISTHGASLGAIGSAPSSATTGAIFMKFGRVPTTETIFRSLATSGVVLHGAPDLHAAGARRDPARRARAP